MTAEGLGSEWDFTKPHKEMRISCTVRRSYFPDYFTDGTDAFVDTSQLVVRYHTEWLSLPTQYRAFDSSTALHCFGGMSGGVGITHYMSWDGGETWELQDYNITGSATEIEEWEWHSSGVHDLMVVNIRCSKCRRS